MAYPVYLTIGNIPKEIRCKPSHHGQILLAYLPTTKLEHIDSIAGRCWAVSNLYHACVGKITQPLGPAGVNGVEMSLGNGVEMSLGNGDLHRCHPILAAFIRIILNNCLGHAARMVLAQSVLFHLTSLVMETITPSVT